MKSLIILCCCVFVSAISYAGQPYCGADHEGVGNPAINGAVQMLMEQRRGEQRGLDQLNKFTNDMVDRANRKLSERIDREFMDWPDKSDSGVMSFSRRWNLNIEETSRYLRLARSLR